MTREIKPDKVRLFVDNFFLYDIIMLDKLFEILKEKEGEYND